MPNNERFLFSTKKITSNTNNETRNIKSNIKDNRAHGDSFISTFSSSINKNNNTQLTKVENSLEFICSALKRKYLHYDFELNRSVYIHADNIIDTSIPIYIKSIDKSPITDDVIYEINKYLILILEIINQLIYDINKDIKEQVLQGIILCREISIDKYYNAKICDEKNVAQFIEHYFQPGFKKLSNNVSSFTISGHKTDMKFPKPETIRNIFKCQKTSTVFGKLTPSSRSDKIFKLEGYYVDGDIITNIPFSGYVTVVYGPNIKNHDLFDDIDSILELNKKLYFVIEPQYKFVSIENVKCGKYSLISYEEQID